jgi:tRNA pseudouridine38-40 synthase
MYRRGRDWAVWYFDVCGSGFLYKQVRLMVGALLSLGRGRCSLADIATALEKPRELLPTGSACGLTLMSVFYDSDISPVDRGQPGI